MLERDLLGDELDHLRIDLEVSEVDGGKAVLLRHEVGERGAVDQAELGELDARSGPGGSGLVLCPLEIVRRQQILLDEQLSDAIFHGSLRCHRVSRRIAGGRQG